MGLTTERLALLNNLTYTNEMADPLPSIYKFEGRTVQDYINNYHLNGNINDQQEYSVFTDGEEWSKILQAVENDPNLCNLRITNIHEGSMGDYALVFEEPNSSEVIVAFRGTGAKEWPDNFQGGGTTGTQDGVSTPQQESALQWYRSLKLEEYGMVTVTGHSKGGNKAQYITIEDETVDRCVSFDGQGFSDEYFQSKSALIGKREAKITNHCAEGDYVNILLNSVGTQKYYEANESSIKSGGFAENHCPNTYLHYDENCNAYMLEGTQMKEVADIDRFLNSYLRSLSPEEKADTLSVIGNLVEHGLDGDFEGLSASDVINQYLNEENYRDKLVPLIGYLIKYQEEYPETAESVKTILEGMGLGEMNATVDSIVKYATDGKIRALFRIDHDVLGNWVTKSFILNDIFKDMGITSDEEKKSLLDLIYMIIIAHDNIDKIEDGRDQRIAYIVPENADKTGSADNSQANLEIAGKADFAINYAQSMKAAKQMRSYNMKLKQLSARINNVSNLLNGTMSVMKTAVQASQNSVADQGNKMNNYQVAMIQIASLYHRTESTISN